MHKKGSKPTNTLGRVHFFLFSGKHTLFQFKNPVTKAFCNCHRVMYIPVEKLNFQCLD